MNLPTALLAAIAGYLLGSISFARLITRWFAPRQDIADLAVPAPVSPGQLTRSQTDHLPSPQTT